MSWNEMKKVVIAVLVSVSGLGAYAQLSALEKPAANFTERWQTNSSGWGVSSDGGNAVCGWTNSSLAISCLPQAMGNGFQSTFRLIASTNSSGGIFVGDYSKIEAVSFSVQPKGVRATLTPVFYFKSISGAVWRYPFMSMCQDGIQSSITISMLNSTNWHGYIGADFNTDKANINEIGFEFIRGQDDLSAQNFSVDNFKLVGPWGGPWANGVPLAWVMETGLTNDFATAGLIDSDGDGFSNAAEFLAGTDPANANSFFKIEIVRNSEGKMAVRWTGNRGVNFGLLEANSLGTDGVFVTKTNIVPATVKTEEVIVDQDAGNTKFYKVVISTNSIIPGN